MQTPAFCWMRRRPSLGALHLAFSRSRFARPNAALLLAALAVSLGIPALHAQDVSAPGNSAVEPSFVSFDFSYVVRVLPPAASRKVRVWVPLPSSDQYQTISQLELKGPVKVTLRKEPRYGDRYGYFDVASSQVKNGFSIRLAFHVVRYERRVNAAAGKSLGGPFPKRLAPFLQADDLAPTDGSVETLAREQTRGLSDPLQKARRIYDYVIAAMQRGTRGTGSGRGDALWAADSRLGDRTDFHSLFIAMARAVGIPARFVIGFSLPEGQEQGTVSSYHSWAEFYVNGRGWVPVDLWQAAQNPGRRDYFFGGLDAHRVMISQGRDVALAPAPQAGRLNYIAYPYVEADGQPSPVASMDFFFNAPGFPAPAPKIFRRPVFAFLAPRPRSFVS